MAVSTKRFTLNNAIYQDLSEGNAECLLILQYQSQPASAVLRISLGTSLPAVNTVNYQQIGPPDDPTRPIEFQFLELEATDRVYGRAENSPVSLVVFRK